MADKRDGKKVGIDQETRKRDKTDAAKGFKVFLCRFLTYRLSWVRGCRRERHIPTSSKFTKPSPYVNRG